MTPPGKYKARREWTHVTVKKEPYGNLIRTLAKERDITMAEMIERMITTYTAMLNHKVIGE
jgi:hypothetical protein